MTNLNQKKCVPCHGGTPKLSEEAISTYLEEVKGWTRVGETIERVFTFKDFKEAWAFLNEVANLAEEEEHHPDIGIFSWNKVKVSLSTHAVKGLTENDFVMAAKIDEMSLD